MAYTFTRSTIKPTDVSGSLRVRYGTVSADAGSGIISTAAIGFKQIVAGSLTPKSAAGVFAMVINAATAAVATPGYVNIRATIGDEFNAIFWGY